MRPGIVALLLLTSQSKEGVVVDEEMIRARIVALPEEELLGIVSAGEGEFTPFAQGIAAQELERRGKTGRGASAGRSARPERSPESRKQSSEGTATAFCERCGAPTPPRGACPKCGHHATRAGETQRKEPASADTASTLFLEPDERLIGRLSRGYASNLVFGSSLSEDWVVLSDRRLYYSGTLFSRVGGRVGRFSAQIVLPLEAISSISYLSSSNVGVLVGAILFFLFGAPFLATDKLWGVTILLWAVALMMLLVYAFSKKHVLLVSSNSASVEIRYDLYGAEQTQAFLKSLGGALSRRRLSQGTPS